MATAPFEIIAAPFIIYHAPVGEAFPRINIAPAGNWSQIGTGGDLNYTEDGVVVIPSQTIVPFTPLGSTAPVKAFRTQEGMAIRFTLADLKLEEWNLILNSNSVTDTAAGGGEAGFRDVDLFMGASVTQFAILARGLFSPYGNGWNCQFEIPVMYQSAAGEQVFQKGTPVGLSLEFTALADPNAATASDRFGKIKFQDEVVV